MSTPIPVNPLQLHGVRYLNRVFPLLLPVLLALSPTTFAGAQVSITPTRVMFEGRTRTASVTLINRGDKASTFRISFERKRMTEDGQFKDVKQPKPGELFSDQMIRYSPRQVVLPPGKAQVVRLLLRKPPNLADGEYRSHMLFREVPEQSSLSIQEQTRQDQKMVISIKPVLGISIPVIVRQGITQADVKIVQSSLENVSPDKTRAILKMTMTRSGNRSVYGDITATYRKNPNDKKPVVVAQINGVAVYAPNESRLIKIPVQAPSGVTLAGGRIDIVFRTNPAAGNKILAQGHLEVPTGK